MAKAKLEKSAGAVVFRKEDNKIWYLLLQHKAGHWGFPKGIIEKGESLQETAAREIKEETGLNELKFLAEFKETEKYFYKLKGRGIFKIVTYLLAETKQREVGLSFEHIAYQWLPYEKAEDVLSFKNAKEILKKAHYLLTS